MFSQKSILPLKELFVSLTRVPLSLGLWLTGGWWTTTLKNYSHMGNHLETCTPIITPTLLTSPILLTSIPCILFFTLSFWKWYRWFDLGYRWRTLLSGSYDGCIYRSQLSDTLWCPLRFLIVLMYPAFRRLGTTIR